MDEKKKNWREQLQDPENIRRIKKLGPKDKALVLDAVKKEKAREDAALSLGKKANKAKLAEVNAYAANNANAQKLAKAEEKKAKAQAKAEERKARALEKAEIKARKEKRAELQAKQRKGLKKLSKEKKKKIRKWAAKFDGPENPHFSVTNLLLGVFSSLAVILLVFVVVIANIATRPVVKVPSSSSRYNSRLKEEMELTVADPIIELLHPELFTDANNNNVWDSGEAYVDENGNEQYDSDTAALNMSIHWTRGKTLTMLFTVRNYNKDDEISAVSINYLFQVKSSNFYPLTYTLQRKNGNSWANVAFNTSIDSKTTFLTNNTAYTGLNHSSKTTHYYKLTIAWPNDDETNINPAEFPGEFIQVSLQWQQQYNINLYPGTLVTGSVFNNLVKNAKTITFDYANNYTLASQTGDNSQAKTTELTEEEENKYIDVYQVDSSNAYYFDRRLNQVYATNDSHFIKQKSNPAAINGQVPLVNNTALNYVADVSAAGDGSVKLYYDNSTDLNYYVLSTRRINANANCQNMFNACSALTTINFNNINTAGTTSMIQMFYDCPSLTSLDLSNFNTSNVTTMRRMFNNCNRLTSLDISNFNTSKVTDMYYMYALV